jgi:hypothetical protein
LPRFWLLPRICVGGTNSRCMNVSIFSLVFKSPEFGDFPLAVLDFPVRVASARHRCHQREQSHPRARRRHLAAELRPADGGAQDREHDREGREASGISVTRSLLGLAGACENVKQRAAKHQDNG